MNNEKFSALVVSAVEEHGLKYGYVAKQAGMSRQLLSAKVHGKCRWNIDEVATLTKLLEIPTEIWM